MVIVSALIDLATGLGMMVTAESVETQAQLDWLASAACTEAQGYLISRPLSTADFAIVREGRASSFAGPELAQPAACSA